MRYIYNSRNYKGLLDFIRDYRKKYIYNSRNYKGLLDIEDWGRTIYIYNSRNYKGLLDFTTGELVILSTTVEIIRVS